MDLKAAIDKFGVVQTAGHPHYYEFPYVNAIGVTRETLTVRVPIHGDAPSERDKAALLEAVKVQGALGEWKQQDDGEVWLSPHA
jgi:hypothetical protein